MQAKDFEIEAFLALSISIRRILGCDMVWCNFPGHYNVLPNCFSTCISDSTDASIKLYVVCSLIFFPCRCMNTVSCGQLTLSIWLFKCHISAASWSTIHFNILLLLLVIVNDDLYCCRYVLHVLHAWWSLYLSESHCSTVISWPTVTLSEI